LQPIYHLPGIVRLGSAVLEVLPAKTKINKQEHSESANSAKAVALSPDRINDRMTERLNEQSYNSASLARVKIKIRTVVGKGGD